jgi:hypothetical protein
MYQVIQISKFDGEVEIFIRTFSEKAAADAYHREMAKECFHVHTIKVDVDGPEISWID